MRISDWSSDVCSSDLRGHVRDFLQQVHVLGVPGELEVADHGREWRAAEGAVLLLVDFLEQLRLVEVRGVLEVLDQFLLEIGRASCRERVCQYVEISVVAVALKKKNT